MHNLLHFHFESALRANRIIKPRDFKSIKSIFKTTTFIEASPLKRLQILEEQVKKISLNKEYYTQQLFRKIVKGFIRELISQKINHVDLRISINYRKWEGIEDYKEAEEIFINETKPYKLSLCFLAAVNFSKSYSDLNYIFSEFTRLFKSSKFLVGIDINLIPEDMEKFVYYAPLIRNLQEQGAKVNIHLGELFDNKVSRAILSHVVPNRISHGIFLLNDPYLIKIITVNNICLDMCPVSNTILGVIDWNTCNPAKLAISAGIPVTINTDDPLIFETDIEKEYTLASLTKKEIRIVKANSKKYCYKR